jgi:two-component system chemotaxis response regulator CheY
MNNPQLRRILIVDDEPFMRATVKQMLRLSGQFTFEEAGDGAAALNAVAEFKPDLVICDNGMVPMTGLDFLKKLRAHEDEALRRTLVIMLTADAKEETLLGAARLKVSGYLVKPVSPKKLGERLRQVFTGSQSAQAQTRT